MISPCPSVERLDGLLKSDSEDAEVAEHLEICAKCRRQLETMAGEEELPKPSAQPTATSPLLQRAIQQLKTDQLDSPSRTAVDPALSTGSPPPVFGDYEILHELGRGGMGVVYRARQRSLNRDVAVKLILAGQLASPHELRRFRTEAEAAAMLDHPNIVPIYEIGEHEGRHYFSMKFVDGRPLSDCLAELRAWKSPRDIALLVAVLARAVHYAHQRGILHRDLKPANILLDAQGRPHLTDFGLAKVMERDHGLTHSNAIMGTPDYMAPEVAAGKTKEVTTAADVHSLGAILYELLTGQRPFHAETVGATLQRLLTAEPRRPRTLSPAVPRDLETIALKCLEKEPAKRYSSAAALAEELDRFTQGEPILARPVSAPERLWRWSRRKPALASALAGLCVVIVLGLAGIVTQWRRAEAHARRESQQRERAESAVFQSQMKTAQALLESGSTAQGLAQLAMQLRERPTNRVVAERLLNALTFRAFCLPIALLGHQRALQLQRSEQSQFAVPTLSVNFSRDGRRVVTAGKDGAAHLWDEQTGDPLIPPLRHEAEVRWADFDPEGRRIITASLDGTARIWFASTGEMATPPLKHQAPVAFAAFSGDGKYVITASEDHTAQVWDAQTGQPLGAPLLHDGPVYYAAFSPDAKYVVTAERERLARLWQRETGKPIGTINHLFRKEALQPFPRFAPAGESLATFNGRSATLWRIAKPPSQLAWLKHDAGVTTLDYSYDGRSLATASHDGTLVIWDALKGTRLRSLRHQHGVVSVQFGREDEWVLTGSRDRTARLWGKETGQPLAEPLRHEEVVVAARLNVSGSRIATIAWPQGAWLWQVCSEAPAPLTYRHRGPVTMAHFDPSGRRVLAVGQAVGALFDASTGQVVAELAHGVQQEILDAAFTPDGRMMTATAYANTALWTATGERMGAPLRVGEGGELGRRSALHALSVAGSDGGLLVTASEDGIARVWDTQSRTFLSLVHSSRVNGARFSPDGRWVVTASWDKTACLWDARTGQPLLVLRHDRPVDWADFDPSGQRVATASKDKCVRLWSARTGDLIAPPLRHADAFPERYPFEFSPDGTLLATVAGNALQIWRTNGQSLTASLKHQARLNSVRFSQDGKRVVVACEDGTAQIWDAQTGHVLSEPLRHEGAVNYAEFSPDGRQVLTCSQDGTAKVWPVLAPPVPAPAWLPEVAEALAGERMDAENQNQPVPVEALYRLREQLKATSGTTYYDRWAAWFFADSDGRENWPR